MSQASGSRHCEGCMAQAAPDITALYDRYGDDLLVFLVRRTADPELALDLWAETFAQAIVGAGKYRGSTDAEAAGWLYGIAKNQLRHYYRRGKAQQRAMAKLGLERPPLGPQTELEILERAGLAEVRAELAQAVAALSTDLREAIALRVLDERPYPDVAHRLGISEQAARTRVSRGLRQLADALDPADLREALQS